jgi:hypothetical protein
MDTARLVTRSTTNSQHQALILSAEGVLAKFLYFQFTDRPVNVASEAAKLFQIGLTTLDTRESGETSSWRQVRQRQVSLPTDTADLLQVDRQVPHQHQQGVCSGETMATGDGQQTDVASPKLALLSGSLDGKRRAAVYSDAAVARY